MLAFEVARSTAKLVQYFEQHEKENASNDDAKHACPLLLGISLPPISVQLARWALPLELLCEHLSQINVV